MVVVAPPASVTPVTVMTWPATPTVPVVALVKPLALPVVDGALQPAGSVISTAPLFIPPPAAGRRIGEGQGIAGRRRRRGEWRDGVCARAISGIDREGASGNARSRAAVRHRHVMRAKGRARGYGHVRGDRSRIGERHRVR